MFFRRLERVALGAMMVLIAGFCVALHPAHAEFANLVTAPLVAPTAAWNRYGAGTNHSAGVSAWTSDVPEFVALARNLGGGGRLSSSQFTQNVFDYVRNNIEVEFRFGLGKGGRGALIDQSGTPFDQAELMVKILRQGGVPASYQVGTINLDGHQFGLWTGLVIGLDQTQQTFTVDAHQACQFLADGGIPATVNGASDCTQVSGALSVVTMSHIWVQANGNLYDPSFKTHVLKAAIDISAAMGCGSISAPTCGSSIVSAAMTGATAGTDSTGGYVQNLNQIALNRFYRPMRLVSAVTNVQPLAGQKRGKDGKASPF